MYSNLFYHIELHSTYNTIYLISCNKFQKICKYRIFKYPMFYFRVAPFKIYVDDYCQNGFNAIFIYTVF